MTSELRHLRHWSNMSQLYVHNDSDNWTNREDVHSIDDIVVNNNQIAGSFVVSAWTKVLKMQGLIVDVIYWVNISLVSKDTCYCSAKPSFGMFYKKSDHIFLPLCYKSYLCGGCIRVNNKWIVVTGLHVGLITW